MTSRVSRCINCGESARTLIDFGPQPPSNRFHKNSESQIDLHSLALGQCFVCGLVQLVDPMSPAMVRSRFSWMIYNEPEGHLDALVEHLMHLPGIQPKSVIAGLTYKDDSTLARFNGLGLSRTHRLDASSDLGLDDPTAGLESIQEAVNERRARESADRHGRADMLIVRHVIEHAHSPQSFLQGLMQLVKPGGYIVLEVPDSRQFLDACDYSFVWEEHIAYFSPATLKALLKARGCEVVEILTYPYALEDSLVAVVRTGALSSHDITEKLQMELTRGEKYASRFPEIRNRHRERFSEFRRTGKRVAVFGAGHLAVKFLNFFELGSYVDCVIDDNPNKQALVMPGSRLPIRG